MDVEKSERRYKLEYSRNCCNTSISLKWYQSIRNNRYATFICSVLDVTRIGLRSYIDYPYA